MARMDRARYLRIRADLEHALNVAIEATQWVAGGDALKAADETCDWLMKLIDNLDREWEGQSKA